MRDVRLRQRLRTAVDAKAIHLPKGMRRDIAQEGFAHPDEAGETFGHVRDQSCCPAKHAGAIYRKVMMRCDCQRDTYGCQSRLPHPRTGRTRSGGSRISTCIREEGEQPPCGSGEPHAGQRAPCCDAAGRGWEITKKRSVFSAHRV